MRAVKILLKCVLGLICLLPLALAIPAWSIAWMGIGPFFGHPCSGLLCSADGHLLAGGIMLAFLGFIVLLIGCFFCGGLFAACFGSPKEPEHRTDLSTI